MRSGMSYAVSLKHVHGTCSLHEVRHALVSMGAEIVDVLDERKIVFEAGPDAEVIAERLYFTSSVDALYALSGGLEVLYEAGRWIRLDFGGLTPREKEAVIRGLRERGIVLGERGPLYLVLRTSRGLRVYRALAEYRRDRFKPRSPEKRVFFLSSALNPLSALLLINLSLTDESSTLLDPFSGTGSILIEGALMGLYSVGVEIDYRQARGALRNIRQYGLHGNVDIVLADSTHAPFRDGCFDALATDPPYGRYASTHKRSLEEIYGALIELAGRVIERGRAVFFTPHWMTPRCESGLREACSIYIHSDLTRRLWVYDVDA